MRLSFDLRDMIDKIEKVCKFLADVLDEIDENEGKLMSMEDKVFVLWWIDRTKGEIKGKGRSLLKKWLTKLSSADRLGKFDDLN